MNETEYLYFLINKKSKRVYVGRSGNPNLRYRSHITALKADRHKNALMTEDFKKYGESSFCFKKIGFCRGLTGTGIEGKAILLLNTYDMKKGYNYSDPFALKKSGEQTSKVIDWKESQTLKTRIQSDIARKIVIFGDDSMLKHIPKMLGVTRG